MPRRPSTVPEVVHDLHVHEFGPEDGPAILAIHGVTGHGGRWRRWASRLPEAHVIAPDLIGHGRSSWLPPWGIEAQVDALIAVLDRTAGGRPVLVVGHSYGGCLALHLARRLPDRVSGLVLLDPAMAVDPARLAEAAESTIRYGDYTDAEEAWHDKRSTGWSDVPDDILREEIDEHLIDYPAGRVGWRMSLPAVVATWGELARAWLAPPSGIPVTVVRAARVQPPYLRAEHVDALVTGGATVLDWDCEHMVPQAREADSAAVAADLLPARPSN